MICSYQNQENEPDDGPQCLNESDEGLEEEPRDEGQTNNDGEENFILLAMNLSSFSPPDQANLLQGYEDGPKRLPDGIK